MNRAKGTLLGGNGAQGREPPATGVDRPPTPLANGVGVQRDGPGQGGGVDPQQLTNVQPALSQYSKRCGTKSSEYVQAFGLQIVEDNTEYRVVVEQRSIAPRGLKYTTGFPAKNQQPDLDLARGCWPKHLLPNESRPTRAATKGLEGEQPGAALDARKARGAHWAEDGSEKSWGRRVLTSDRHVPSGQRQSFRRPAAEGDLAAAMVPEMTQAVHGPKRAQVRSIHSRN